MLQPLSWNECWRWRTLFYATYIDESGQQRDIGSVKIASLSAEYEEAETGSGTRTALPQTFELLPKEFASLGQDESYYLALWSLLGKVEMREALSGLRDLVLDQNRLNEEMWVPTVSRSLTRSVPIHTVRHTFANIAQNGDPKRSFNFTYSRPSQNPLESSSPLGLDFAVEPGSTPPTNVHVLIGRNGSGKTTLLQSMTRTLLGPAIGRPEDGILSTSTGAPNAGIANLVYVAFSAFDEVDVPVYDSPNRWMVPYSFVGLQTLPQAALRDLDRYEGREPEPAAQAEDAAVVLRGDRRNRKPEQLASDFARSAAKVVNKSAERWREALINLESDPNFRDADVSSLADPGPRVASDESFDFERRAVELFKRMSSGHKIVLLTTTRLVETVTAETLVVLDEPEGHLHPPLLSAFTRALSTLMQQQNGVAIIATHSPVILQEVPSRCVWRIDRTGHSKRGERLVIESFGENVGTLTNDVFGLEVRESGFHKLLIEAAKTEGSYEAVVAKYGNELGFEARALLFSWFARQQEQQD